MSERLLEKKVRIIHNQPVNKKVYVGYAPLINPFFNVGQKIKNVYYHVFRLEHKHRTIR